MQKQSESGGEKAKAATKVSVTRRPAQTSAGAHRRTQTSGTLNRRYVSKPTCKKVTVESCAEEKPTTCKATAKTTPKNTTKITIDTETPKSPKITRMPKAVNIATSKAKTKATTKPALKTVVKPTPKAIPKDAPVQAHPLQVAAKAAKITPRVAKPTSKEIKERAIKEAVNNITPSEILTKSATKEASVETFHPKKTHGALRFFLAIGCATACIFAIIGIVSSNIPDIPVQVAAMQTGIDASYPSYVPRDYSLANVLSEENKVTMNFVKDDENGFTLTEEKSSWDSAALKRNFVEEEWGKDYATTHEQGITVYISENSPVSAAWVNGGVLYKIVSEGDNLTKKQIRNIVLSL